MSDLSIKVGTYTAEDGQQKNKRKKLGVIKKGENGPYIMIDPTVDLGACLLLQNQMSGQNRDNVMVSIFAKTQPRNQGMQQVKDLVQEFDDDIPF